VRELTATLSPEKLIDNEEFKLIDQSMLVKATLRISKLIQYFLISGVLLLLT